MAYQDKKKRGMRLPEDNNNIDIELNVHDNTISHTSMYM
jgi:hypothetical protein